MMYAATGVCVTTLVHNEAQFGKTELDGLFGICTQAVTRYVDAGHDVTTSAELVKALVANGPRRNVIRGLATKNDAWHLKALNKYLKQTKIPHVRAVREVEYKDDGLHCHTHSLVGQPRIIPWSRVTLLPGWRAYRDTAGPAVA